MTYISKRYCENTTGVQFDVGWQTMLRSCCMLYRPTCSIRGSAKMGQDRKLLGQVKMRKLKYFGHTTRHSSLETDILIGTMPGKRRQGGQRKQWLDDVIQWSGKSLVETVRLAEDRDRYRSFVHQVAYARTSGTVKSHTCNDGVHACWPSVALYLGNSLAEHGLVRVTFLCNEREGSSIPHVGNINSELLQGWHRNGQMIASFISGHSDQNTSVVQLA